MWFRAGCVAPLRSRLEPPGRRPSRRCAAKMAVARRTAAPLVVPLVVPRVGAANDVASRSAGDPAAVAVSPGVIETDVVTHDVAVELSRAAHSGTATDGKGQSA